MPFTLPPSLALTACLLIAAPVVAAAIRDGRFDEAPTVLRPLVRRGAAEDSVRCLLGLVAVGAPESPDIEEARRDALVDEAIAAFHGMPVRRADLVRVRLELGRAFFLKGEDTLAKRHFEQVLAGKPPAAVALNVNDFLNRIRARSAGACASAAIGTAGRTGDLARG